MKPCAVEPCPLAQHWASVLDLFAGRYGSKRPKGGSTIITWCYTCPHCQRTEQREFFKDGAVSLTNQV